MVARCVVGVVVALTAAASAPAADVVKGNNTNALNLGTSWTSGTAPASGDVAVWNSTVTAGNTAAAGANLAWGGIRIANPGGAVVITNAAGNLLTLGASGVDMSAATQNLTIFNTANTTGSIAIAATQQWNVASGRTLTLFATGNTANQRLTGSGNLTVLGGGTVNMLVGDAGNSTFTAGNGNDTYTGNWTITGGSKVISLRNGTHGWGQGSITLDNGIMSQSNGNWSFSNNITLGAGGGTVTNDNTSNSGTRYVNLTGTISGTGSFNVTSSSNLWGEGVILTGSNSFTGPLNILPAGVVRIGGDATTVMNSTSAGTLGSIPAAVAITNNGILGFGWTDARTVGNVITGTGLVRLGRAGGVLPATQVVTLTAASTYTGTTQVNAGRLNLAGSLTSPITVAAAASVTGSGSTTGLLTLASGGGLALAGGTTTTSLTTNGASFGGSNLVTFLGNAVPGTTYDVFTYGSGTVTNPGNLSVGWRGSLSNDTLNQKYVFTAGSTGTLTWNTTSGTWAQGVAGNWTGADGTFYGGDTAVFNEPASPSTVTLSGLLAPATVIVNNTTNPYTFSGVAGSAEITGGGSLVKNGAGLLAITSAQTYTGTTAVNAGSVDVGNGGSTGSLGSGAVSVAAGADLAFNRSSDFTVANVLSGAGTITKKGAGRMTVSGSNSAGPLNWNFTGLGNRDIGFTNAAAVGGAGSTITVQASGSGSTFFSTSGNSTGVAITIGAGGTFTWNGSTGNTSTLTGPISGAGAFTKVSGETLILTATSPLTGPVVVSAGRMRVDGAFPASSGVFVASGATLGGSGSIGGTITGAVDALSGGLVSPGASPGILTAAAVDPASGLDFAFELSALGSPDYTTPAASLNDVLRLTAATPFAAALASTNVVDVYLDRTTVTAGDVFRGGFYSDQQSDFMASIGGGTFAFWVKGNGSGTDRTFNGQGYYSLANYDPLLTVSTTTVSEPATFGGESVGGGVTQFTIIPEPTSTVAGVATVILACLVLRRRP